MQQFFLNLVHSLVDLQVHTQRPQIYVLPTVLCHCLGNRGLEIADTMNHSGWPRTPSDYDMLCGMIDKYQMRTAKLSALLQLPAVALPVMFSAATGLFFLILALGPRPPEISHPSLERYMPVWLAFVLTVFFLTVGFQAMMTPVSCPSGDSQPKSRGQQLCHACLLTTSARPAACRPI